MKWEHRLENVSTLDEQGRHVFVCPLCAETRPVGIDDLDSYDMVTGHLDSHPAIDLGAAVIEARSWARHGYEIGQRSATWTDAGVAPRWLAS